MDALAAKPAQKSSISQTSPPLPPPSHSPQQPGPTTAADSPVPIVDFGGFCRENDEQARRKVAREIDAALRTVGFVYLRNHGVPGETVDEAFEWSKKFFALPLATKNLAPHPPGGTHHRGYSSPGLEKVSQHTYAASTIADLRAAAPDVKESFECGNETDGAQPNIWPPDAALPGFRTAMMAFFDQCSTLVHAVLRALALALSLDDESALSAAHAASAFQLRLLHYPPVAARALRQQAAARIGAHSDFGSLTLLFQDAVGGLEVESPPGRYRPAPPVDGAVLVNVGDLLERWSNGRWRSTVHRVGLPAHLREAREREGEGEGEGEDDMVAPRYSLPFFSAPDPDTVIEALPGCWDEANPKKYPPVTAAEYVNVRMNAIY
ncbi:thymine dioxygenase [Phyllosticta citrichinensis]|uniref:Thymine dioxygenase n=1 Tax=Phyllosticta citrichinensis TaxID=1130410 RepID=A0ABR1Y1P1_9PEZI